MENIELNRRAVTFLEQWDPFQFGPIYDTEAADVVAALQTEKNAVSLAKKIQAIYEYSFEQLIPMDTCLEKAHQLIEIRYATSCEY
jgi:hypothetical protein